MPNNRKHVVSCATALCVMLLAAAAGSAEQNAGAQAAARNMSDMKFGQLPGLPACAPGSVQSGDPGTGPSVILAKTTAGCTIPWHWHTPNEHVMMVAGAATVQMKDGQPVSLGAGGFALMPSHHVHQFRCGKRPCVLYVYSDAVFDIHYVDAQGNELAPDQAFKAAKEPRKRK